jgi:transglutaminase-like putative cysteine protease
MQPQPPLPLPGNAWFIPGNFSLWIKCLLVFTGFAIVGQQGHAQSADDEYTADQLKKKYPDSDVSCLKAYHLYTFDKGKNALGDKVVVLNEESEVEFIALTKFASIAYPEYYNKFIQIKTFKKELKYKTQNKYYTSARSGIDRSVTSDGIFFDDSRVQYYPIRFNWPGARARVTVKKEYSDSKYLTRLFFDKPYPIKEQIFEFKVPEWLTIDFKEMNFEGFTIEKRQTRKNGYVNYMFTMRDVVPHENEFKSIGPAYTNPHIIIQIKSFVAKGETYTGFDNIGDVYKWNNRLYGMAENKTEKLKETLDKIVKGKAGDADKIKAIYYWTQDNIRYLAYEDGYSGYIPTAAEEVLSKKYGDCKGMANLLTEFLKMAGFDAHFTWIGTRQIPYSQNVPALCVNNHAITTLYFKGKEYFLDATENYVPFGENAYRIQGKEALIAKGDQFEVKQVPLSAGIDHKVETKADFVLHDNMLKGKLKVVLTGNERTDFHQGYQLLPVTAREDFLREFMEFDNNMEASNIKTSDLSNREIPAVIESDVQLINNVQNISGDKYIAIDFFPRTLERYLPDEKRKAGYDLDYLLTYEDEISLTVPADKKFTDVPDKLELNTPGYRFNGSYVVSGNKITLRKILELKNSVVKKSDFKEWTKFLNAIKDFNKYFIAITKK